MSSVRPIIGFLRCHDESLRIAGGNVWEYKYILFHVRCR